MVALAHRPQQPVGNYMSKIIEKLLVVALLSGAFAAQLPDANAAEPRTVSQPGTVTTVAKILVVDRTARALTVDVNGTIHLYWLASNVKVKKDGTDVALADLAPGQSVKFTTQKNARGDREVIVEVTIELSDTETEAAGRKGTQKVTKRDRQSARDAHKRRGPGTPALFSPPPVIRTPVSPHN